MIISKCTSKPEYKLREACIKENLTANRFRGSKNCKPINCEKEEHIFMHNNKMYKILYRTIYLHDCDCNPCGKFFKCCLL